jgi:hypothetical protein
VSPTPAIQSEALIVRQSLLSMLHLCCYRFIVMGTDVIHNYSPSQEVE